MNKAHKKFTISIAILIALHADRALATTVEAENESSAVKTTPLIMENQLLLPRSYQQHRPALWKAAALTAQTPRCHRFLMAELHLDLSRLTHPIFRARCRDKDNVSYALLIDGLSMHVLDDTRPGGSISFADLQAEIEAERERLRLWEEALIAEQLAETKRREDIRLEHELEEQQLAEAKRRELLWEHCREQLNDKVRNMSALVWLTQEMPIPEVDGDNRLIYIIDFDARDLRQQQLRYRAKCDVSEIGDARVLIRPRELSK